MLVVAIVAEHVKIVWFILADMKRLHPSIVHIMTVERIAELIGGKTDLRNALCDPVINIIASILASHDERYITSMLARGALNELYLKDGGISLAKLASAIYKIHTPYLGIDQYPEIKSQPGKIKLEPLEITALQQICNQGYTIMKNNLWEECDDPEVHRRRLLLRNYKSESTKGGGSIHSTIVTGQNLCEQSERIGYYMDKKELMRDQLVVQILQNKTVSSVLDTIFPGGRRVSDVNLWISTASAEDAKKYAQAFHYDLDHLSWIKLFYYVCDVGIENGSHVYVPGTHLPGAKSAELLRNGYVRHDDDVILGISDQNAETIVGPAGTFFMGNTLCWHKGSRVRQGYRMILSITVSPDGAFSSDEPFENRNN